MEKEKIRKQIVSLVEPYLEQAGITIEDIDFEESLLFQGAFDSVTFVGLIAELEEKFKIEFDFEKYDPTEFSSVNGLIQIVTNDC